MKNKLRRGLRTWIEIDKKAIKHNYAVFRSLISKKTKLMGVVKSNAYGHNIFEFAKELERLGADYLAVDSVMEGMALRREGIKTPILILGYTLPERFEDAINNNLDITVSNFQYFEHFKKLDIKKVIQVHIKADTGMHRHGFQVSDIEKVISEINKLNDKVKVVGLYTHFAKAKDPLLPNDTMRQLQVFAKWQKAFFQANISPLCHTCATSGTILFPEAQMDMVRIGIGLYGIWPSVETKKYLEPKQTLHPVLSWRSVVAEINNIKKGERIGYDFTKKLSRNTKVAVIPIGYWHGYARALSNIGEVIIKGKKVKVLGRVCMDIIMVDVTDISSAKVGDVVIIIGKDGKEQIQVDDIATLLKGSAYEFITRINPLIKRIYT